MPKFVDGASYFCTPIEWGISKSKKKSTSQVFIRFTVDLQIDPDSDTGTTGAPAGEGTWYGYLTPDASAITFKSLSDMGYDKPNLRGLVPGHEGSYDFSAQQLIFKCEHEQHDGKTVERWSYGDRPKVKMLGDDEIAMLDNMYSDQLAKMVSAAAEAKPAAADMPNF